MNAFPLVAAVVGAALLYVWWRPRRRVRRRARLRRESLPQNAQDILAKNIGQYSHLPTGLKDQLHGHINVLLDEKQFTGCAGQEISDEVRITVAGVASFLLLNREVNYFPGFSSILVYPEAYVATETSYDGNLEVRRQTKRAGESWHRGPVVLSWKDTLLGAKNAGDGYNVVLHEFAHKLDEENAGTNGQPILHDASHYDEWASVLGKEYESLQDRVSRGKNKVIDEYGLTSPPEFFAVATESFFEKPKAMQTQLPELYAQLSRYYCVNPAEWQA